MNFNSQDLCLIDFSNELVKYNVGKSEHIKYIINTYLTKTEHHLSKDERKDLKQYIHYLENKNTNFKNNINDLKTNINDLKNNINDLENDNIKLKNNNKELKNNNKILKNDYENIINKNNKLLTEHSNYKAIENIVIGAKRKQNFDE